VFLQNVGKEEEFDDHEEDEEFDRHEEPELPAQAHRREAVTVETVNPSKPLHGSPSTLHNNQICIDEIIAKFCI
jgi:hypothetical protein